MEIDPRQTYAVISGDIVGEAFRLSGKNGAPARRMQFASERVPDVQVWDVAFALIDTLVTKTWTGKRGRATSGALRGWPDARIAGLWTPPVRQPTVARGLEDASWPVIELTIERFEREFATT